MKRHGKNKAKKKKGFFGLIIFITHSSPVYAMYWYRHWGLFLLCEAPNQRERSAWRRSFLIMCGEMDLA